MNSGLRLGHKHLYLLSHLRSLQLSFLSCFLLSPRVPCISWDGWMLYLNIIPSCSIPELSTTHLQSSVGSMICREQGRACWWLHTTFNSKCQHPFVKRPLCLAKPASCTIHHPLRLSGIKRWALFLGCVCNFSTLPLMNPQPLPFIVRLLNVELLSAGEVCSSS